MAGSEVRYDGVTHSGRLWGGWLWVDESGRAAAALEEAFALECEGRYEAALEVLRKGIREAPASPGLFEARGALYDALGFRRAAAREFERALELDRERPQTWVGLARMRLELGQPTAAREALHEADLRGCADQERFLIGARAARSLGAWDEAAEHYEATLERTRTPSPDLLIEVASLYCCLGEKDPALARRAHELLSDLAVIDPNDPRLRLLRSKVDPTERATHDRSASRVALQAEPDLRAAERSNP